MDKVYKNAEIARKNVKFITNTPSKHGINVMFLKKEDVWSVEYTHSIQRKENSKRRISKGNTALEERRERDC